MRILATLLLLLTRVALAAPDDWIKIDLLGVEGMSGLARLSDNRYVTCDGGVLAELDLDSLAVIPIADADMTGMTNLEAVCRWPGRSGHYLLASKDGKVQEVVRDEKGDYSLGHLSFRLSGGSTGNDFEGFDVATLGDHAVMVWGDCVRGTLSYALFPPLPRQEVAPLETVVYKPPLTGAMGGVTLAISDLKVSDEGELVIVSNTRSSRLLPETSCVAIAGHFAFTDGRPDLLLREHPDLLFLEKTGRTVEGIEQTAQGWNLVTDDNGSAAFTTFPTVELFDGRENFTHRRRVPSSAESVMVKEELVRRASHPVLKRRLDQLNPSLEDFEVRDWSDGSFTRAGARQRAYLYRYSHTNGLVITEDDEVAAHYSGDPGDYARFLAVNRAPDLDGNGLDDLVLVCATEDTSDLYAHVFSLGPSGAAHLGRCTVSAINIRPDDAPTSVEEVQETAFRFVAVGSTILRQRYTRHAERGWVAQGSRVPLVLEDAGRFILRRLD